MIWLPIIHKYLFSELRKVRRNIFMWPMSWQQVFANGNIIIYYYNSIIKVCYNFNIYEILGGEYRTHRFWLRNFRWNRKHENLAPTFVFWELLDGCVETFHYLSLPLFHSFIVYFSSHAAADDTIFSRTMSVSRSKNSDLVDIFYRYEYILYATMRRK